MLLEDSTQNPCTLNDVCLITGLTDRTIRNYISIGILKGKKTNGIWYFSPEDVEEFVQHPSVRPSLQAKRNGYIYDFIMNPSKEHHRCCIILDLPNEDESTISAFFCHAICTGHYHDINFSFDGGTSVPRAILRGDTKELLRLVNSFYNRV